MKFTSKLPKILLSLLLCSGGMGVFHAEANFTQYIQNLYHTVLKYELVIEDQEGEWTNKNKSGFEHNQKEFNTVMKCIFVQAEEESRFYFEDLAKEKLEDLEDIDPLPEFKWPEEVKKPRPPIECILKRLTLKDIFKKQKKAGFKTKCDPDESKNPLVEELWHYCRVTEMVLNELWAKEEVDLFLTEHAKSRNATNFAFEQEAKKPLEDQLETKQLRATEYKFLESNWSSDVYGNDTYWTRESVMHVLEQYRRNFRNYLYQIKNIYDTEWAKGVYCRHELIRCWSWDAAFGPQEEEEDAVGQSREMDPRLGRFFNPTKTTENSCKEEGKRKECIVSDFCRQEDE